MRKVLSDAVILEGFETLARNLSIEIRYEKGNFQGGLCRIDGQPAFIINKDLSISQKIKVLAKELASFDLEGIYILPAIRAIIETEKEA